MPRIFLTVAEVSGDQHAAQLVRALRQLAPSAVIEGHGGPLMSQAGAIVHWSTTQGARMGLGGVLRAWEVWRMLRWTSEYFQQNRPDLLVGVDSPAMNFHFARLAHERGIPFLQYVAPQLWAWRPGRIKKVRRWIDHLACILPFEEAYFRQRGVQATFVGHPLFDELDARRQTQPPPGYPERPPVVGLLAGSRRSEAAANFPRMVGVAQILQGQFPGVRFLSPTTAATDALVRQLGRDLPTLHVEQDAFDRLVPQCDLCLTVSGTATLHVAAYGVPMVVVYRMNPLLVRTFGWLMHTDTFALVNLLAPQRKHIVPELIPWLGPIDNAAETAVRLLRDPAALEAQRRALGELVQSLDRPGASLNVAQLALRMIRGPVFSEPAVIMPGADQPSALNRR